MLLLAFPLYESVTEAWELLHTRIPERQHLITAGINKIHEYVAGTQEAAFHTLAMVANPSLKFEWINQHWLAFHWHQAYNLARTKVTSTVQLCY